MPATFVVIIMVTSQLGEVQFFTSPYTHDRYDNCMGTRRDVANEMLELSVLDDVYGYTPESIKKIDLLCLHPESTDV